MTLQPSCWRWRVWTGGLSGSLAPCKFWRCDRRLRENVDAVRELVAARDDLARAYRAGRVSSTPVARPPHPRRTNTYN